MDHQKSIRMLDGLRRRHPEKFVAEAAAFSRIHRGDRIFISSACGEPQHLVRTLVEYVRAHPGAFYDAEVLHVWTLGVAPYTDTKLKSNFRHNSFFISENTREAVNQGAADYTPVFLSQVPSLFRQRRVPIDVALIQTSLPDEHGYLNLGVSVDIVKAAVDAADTVIAQVNAQMPRTHGDGFIHTDEVDAIIPHDEPLLEFLPDTDRGISEKIGRHISALIEDGDTIQIGYGAMPNAILRALSDKRHLGIHTELLGDGIVDLLRIGVVDNSRKSLNRGKTVATFCMGTRSSYDFIDDNPSLLFRTADYTNDPLVIAQHENMVAINSALEIDLTGQATAESLGDQFFSGIGGQADFMRGAVLAPNGRSILALRSTADGERISRVVPALREGAGVTLNRGDVHYVVTEYGIAYLHGKNVRERAMELIGIAHPKFRASLLEEAKKRKLVYPNQAFVKGVAGEYPAELECHRTTLSGLEILLRPVKISDEPLLKEFFYSLSDDSLYKRFFSVRKDMPHERLQQFVIIDYSKEMAILAVTHQNGGDVVVGLGQYVIDEKTHTAEVAFVVRDDWQNKGIARSLLRYLIDLARRQGLLGFTAEVLMRNKAMLHIIESSGIVQAKRPILDGPASYEVKITFGDG